MSKKTKRNHYIPKYYLNGFCNSDNIIYCYDLDNDTIRESTVNDVAFINNFYSNEVEEKLNREIEIPANVVLDQIKKKTLPNSEEKTILAKYMIKMLQRVPTGWERAKKAIPQVFDKVAPDFDREVAALIKKFPHKRLKLEQEWEETKQQQIRWKNNPPQDLWHTLLKNEEMMKSTHVLSRLNWTFYVSEQPNFITSDNPVFYTRLIGLNNARSEVNFPISSHILLHASYLAEPSNFYEASKDTIVRANERTVKSANRYIFHCEMLR